jgi:hypothetical protein
LGAVTGAADPLVVKTPSPVQAQALSQEDTMDMLLGGFAFAAIVFGQFAAVVAVHGERKRRVSEILDGTRPDHSAGLIWDFRELTMRPHPE